MQVLCSGTVYCTLPESLSMDTCERLGKPDKMLGSGVGVGSGLGVICNGQATHSGGEW